MKIKTLWAKRQGVLIGLAIWMFLAASTVYAGTYLSSSHGNTSCGVKRSSTSQYTKGNCAHCHEQHASINGSEPDPNSSSPSKFTLFYTNYINQTDNFCFKCHDNTISIAATAIKNRSYSYRAGGWTIDTLDDILEVFSDPPSISSHNLGDIKTFITNQWGYTANSNPCVACHNIHALQGDPANSGNAAKSSATRGYPVSRPSQHSTNATTWGLWGDGAGEKMRDYTLNYQAPYRYNSVTVYEPDGSETYDGSNLTDFVTFCTDCHNATNTIYSNNLARNLYYIDWSSNGDKHGGKQRGQAGDTCDKGILKAPYDDASSYVLSCLDCHESHGSKNAFLLRSEVNGVVVANAISKDSNANGAWNVFCLACHTVTSTGNGGACTAGLHGPPFATSQCLNCHKHNATLCGPNPVF